MPKLIYRNACHKSEDISKKTVIACFPDGSRTKEWLQTLNEDDWEVTSFMPSSRLVCIVVHTKSRDNHLSLTIPEITTNSLS